MPLSTSVSPKSSRCNGASAVLICFCRTRTLNGTLRSTYQGWEQEIPNGTRNPITSRPLRERHTNPYALLYAGQDDFKHGRDLAERLNWARPKRSTLDFAQRRALETPQAWPERGQEAQSPPPDRSIMARLDGLDRTKAALPPDLLRRMEQGMADFERRFEMRQKIEQGMARFEQRFTQWEAKQAQAERERQPA